LGYYKMRGILFWLDTNFLLASQGLCSVLLIGHVVSSVS
jgi:hypothetical protein